MIIVTQTKQSLIPWENGEHILINNGQDGRKIIFDYEIILGEYENIERTMEVFNDLILAYIDEDCKCFTMPLK